MFAEIDAACAAFAAQHDLPGLAAGIVRDGRLVHSVRLGMADREAARYVGPGTAFRIASMTKNLTALGVLALRDRGALELDAPLSRYVPAIGAVAAPTSDSPPVTLRHLLTHTAGFVTDDPWADRVLGMSPAELDRLIGDGALFARSPGLAFEYSNLGYALLGRVLTVVSGEPYQLYLRRTFLEPLGMTGTTFDAVAASRGDFAFGYRLDDGVWSRERIEPDGEVGAMGGLATTVPDYARWVAFLLDAWPARDGPDTGPVRRATIREMGLFHAPPFQPDGPVAPASGYGYGLVNSSDRTIGRWLHHSGGLPGYGSHVLLQPDRGLGVFAFANRTYARMSTLTPHLATLLIAADPGARPVAPSPALRRAADAVARALATGRIEEIADACAVNLLLDTPPPQRNAELAALKRKFGEATLAAIEPTHALAGTAVLACANGRLRVQLLLAPDARNGIQKLVFIAEP